MYDSPHRHEITIYKVTVTANGLDQGWTVESLCDDALIWAGLTIATCPRAELTSPPRRRPVPRTARTDAPSQLHAEPSLGLLRARGRGGPGPGSNAGRQTATYSAPSSPTQVAHPLAGPGEHRLPGEHVEPAAVVLDDAPSRAAPG